MTITEPTALIIIDMQQGMKNPKLGARNNPQAEQNIAKLLAVWRAAGRPIVHVRHNSRSPDSVFWPGQADAEFQADFTPRAGEHVLEKNVTDAFANSGLERWLHQRGIRQLVLVGVATNYSVEASARSAGDLGFVSYVVADACFTFDRIDLQGRLRPAEEIHLMSLTNLEGEYASVLDTEALRAQISSNF